MAERFDDGQGPEGLVFAVRDVVLDAAVQVFGQDHRLPVLQPPRGLVLLAADAPVAVPGVIEGLSDGGCFRGSQQFFLLGVV